MGEFSPPLFLSPSSIMLMHRPQTPQPGFGSITLLQKFTPHFKILDPHLKFQDMLFRAIDHHILLGLITNYEIN